MNIQGLDYNTQRSKLLMPEYGREIQKMIDYAITLPTREERLRCAKTIVKLMETRVPQQLPNDNRKQALWDHLYLMSGKQLDIDWPFDVSQADRFQAKPQPLKLPQQIIKLRHYGRLVEEIMEKMKALPPSEERDELVRQTANQMKRDLMLWGHGSVDEEKVANDIHRYTDGAVSLDLSKVKLERFLPASEMPAKKGKKKKQKTDLI